MDSILTSVKKMLGITEEYDHFDADIIMHINSTLSILQQLGVGPLGGFSIFGKEETWDDLLKEDITRLALVKTYLYLQVKLIFDPPLSSAMISSMEKKMEELEWRITNSYKEVKEV